MPFWNALLVVATIIGFAVVVPPLMVLADELCEKLKRRWKIT